MTLRYHVTRCACYAINSCGGIDRPSYAKQERAVLLRCGKGAIDLHGGLATDSARAINKTRYVLEVTKLGSWIGHKTTCDDSSC